MLYLIFTLSLIAAIQGGHHSYGYDDHDHHHDDDDYHGHDDDDNHHHHDDDDSHHHDDDDYHHDDDDHHGWKNYVVEFLERGDGNVFYESDIGLGAGSTDIAENSIYDCKDDDQVGSIAGFSLQITQEIGWRSGQITFKDNKKNSILVQGTFDLTALDVAHLVVIGGTGKYRRASGTATVFSESNSPVDDNRFYWRLEFNAHSNEEQYEHGVNTPKKFNSDHSTKFGNPDIHHFHEDDDDHHHDDDDGHDEDDHHHDDDDSHGHDDDDHHHHHDDDDHHHHHDDDDSHHHDDDDHHHHHDDDDHHDYYY